MIPFVGSHGNATTVREGPRRGVGWGGVGVREVVFCDSLKFLN